MDVGLKLKNFFRDGIHSERVSILVLVDVGLKPILEESELKRLGGFNPCFGGCWS